MISFLLPEDLELVLQQFVGLTLAITVSPEAILLPNGTRSELYLIILTVANIHLKY